MLSALDELADRVAGLQAGASDYLVKPFALEELVLRLSRAAAPQPAGPSGLAPDTPLRAGPDRRPGDPRGAPRRGRRAPHARSPSYRPRCRATRAFRGSCPGPNRWTDLSPGVGRPLARAAGPGRRRRRRAAAASVRPSPR
ncbi:hypothetical protein [Streptomyces sp. NPDC047718]|uniref:hypothetical protein n=1 Tax=Streptomyces sp. NPDC047718 TaxID=3155479 RepID=UPI0033DCEBAE